MIMCYPSMGMKAKDVLQAHQMMKVASFAQCMRVQCTNSYNKNGPAEIIAGTGIMNYHLTEDKK
jgi:hypothetical protein